MATIRYITLILFALALRTTVQAQLTFETNTWDFGTIREIDGRVSHTFTGVNKGDKPLVILDVVTTCGCTVPAFSRKPILPNDKTQITVTFDPTNRPGAFAKELGIYSSDRRKVATLTVQGTVTPRPKSTEELYPIDAGGGLRLGMTLCTFAYIYPGIRMQSAVSYINTSNRTIFLDLKSQSQSGILTTDYPRKIAPGEEGEINFAYLVPAEQPRYGTQRDVMEVHIDGQTNGTQLMTHAIAIDNPKDAGEKVPVSELSENILKFGAVKHAGPIRRQQFTLRNSGAALLVVRAVESEGRISTSLTAGQQVPAGGSLPVEVRLAPGKLDYGIMTDHLVLITNDPVRPMRRVRITAIIED